MPLHPPRRRSALRTAAAAVAAAGGLLVAGCSSGGSTSGPALNSADWASVLRAAKGQRVDWYMYGGDSTLNTFVQHTVADRLKRYGVRLNQVRVSDTADAVDTVLGERQAGKTSGGAVDAVWVNGENFATGVQAGLWMCGWSRDLPNARYVDFADPAVRDDFGVPVRGCEAVWQQADSALVYDSAKLSSADVASVSSLFAWARAHPGRFTYPAPPDFTGSMAVRTILYDTLGGPSPLAGRFSARRYAAVAPRLWSRLNALAPALWRRGSTYPTSQDAVEKLYADGEIDAWFTYGPGAVGDQVKQGQFPASTREAVPAGGNIANDNFVAIPGDAAHPAAALVLADVLEDPRVQLALYRAEGSYPGIDLSRTARPVQAAFAAVPRSASVLPLAALTAHAQPELASGYLTRIERDWKTNVLQR